MGVGPVSSRLDVVLACSCFGVGLACCCVDLGVDLGPVLDFLWWTLVFKKLEDKVFEAASLLGSAERDELRMSEV